MGGAHFFKGGSNVMVKVIMEGQTIITTGHLSHDIKYITFGLLLNAVVAKGTNFRLTIAITHGMITD